MKDNIGYELRSIARLREDLSAEIFIEGKYHIETHWIGEEVYAEGGYYKGSSPWGSNPGEEDGAEYSVTDTPARRYSDTEKRESAKKRLQDLFDSADSCIIRYLAGVARGIDRQGLAKQMTAQLNDIDRKQLKGLYNVLCDYCSNREGDYKWNGDLDTVRQTIGRIMNYSESDALAHFLMREPDYRLSIEELGSVYRNGESTGAKEEARTRLKKIVWKVWDAEKARAAGKELGYSRFKTGLYNFLGRWGSL